MTTEKKQKKVRAKGEPQPAIKWFQERAAETQDHESIASQAKKEKYSEATISIQLGRLRGMGLLPPKEKSDKEPVKTEKKKAASSVRAVPKPSQKKKQEAAASAV